MHTFVRNRFGTDGYRIAESALQAWNKNNGYVCSRASMWLTVYRLAEIYIWFFKIGVIVLFCTEANIMFEHEDDPHKEDMNTYRNKTFFQIEGTI